jgi:hypothetical protein
MRGGEVLLGLRRAQQIIVLGMLSWIVLILFFELGMPIVSSWKVLKHEWSIE